MLPAELSADRVLAVWNHADFQSRSLWLWSHLAQHYASNPWIAGFNPLNEPTDPTPNAARLLSFYSSVYKVIREHDTKHIVFFDGNTFASDFSAFGDHHKEWDNTAYSIHDYSNYGFPAAFTGTNEVYSSTEDQLRRIRRSYERKREWMDQRGLCVWNGEWGPVYDRVGLDAPDTEEGKKEVEKINEGRYKVLRDQLAIYKKVCLSLHSPHTQR
jgi:hypothetical protein